MSRYLWPLLAIAALVVSPPTYAEVAGKTPRTVPGTENAVPKPTGGPQLTLPVDFQNAVEAIARALQNRETAPPHAADGNRVERELRAQEDMATWAERGAYIALFDTGLFLLGVFLLWKASESSLAGARESKRAADAAEHSAAEMRRIGEAQVRAYLTCTGATYLILSNSVMVWPVFKNTGQSPARDIRVAAQIAVSGEKAEISERLESVVPAIPAGHSDNGVFTASNLDPAAHAGLLLADDTFSVNGSVHWRDVFGNVQELPFILVMNEEKGSVAGEGDRVHRAGRLGAHGRSPFDPNDFDAWPPLRGNAPPPEPA